MSGRIFVWDKEKAEANRDKHGIDFIDAVPLFDLPHVSRRSDRNDEERWIALGMSTSLPSRSSTRIAGASGGLSQLDQRAGMSGNDFKLYPGQARLKGRTDFERLRTISDEEIEAAVRDDPDAAPTDIDWSKAELVVPPKKEPISIRVDEDILAFFRRDGTGYQSRMNAVLRAYMEARSR